MQCPKLNQVGKQEVDDGGPEFRKRREGSHIKVSYRDSSGCELWLLRKMGWKILVTDRRKDRQTDRGKPV